MKTGIILLNFGEPERPTPEAVVPFLERIFLTNASLESHATPDAVAARCRQLAEERAPGLIAEYEEIGGSPLNRQAQEQAELLAGELTRRGHEVLTYVAYQFADPLIGEVVRRAREDGVERLIGLPVYPLCGPSTSVAALEVLRREVDALGWDVRLAEVGGWHRHPLYVELRAAGIRETAVAAGLDFASGRTKLVFSAHGTPMKYIREGSRYDDYVRENCAAVATAAGVADYVIGYQNHANRPIEWTQPEIEAVIEEIDADAVVVVPISFMHEQSETLAELDHELREEAESRGLGFHRVPVPHDDARFAAVLADLCEPLLADASPAKLELRACICRPGAVCLNGAARG